MVYLLLGLLIFLGTHSLRIVADDWRSRAVARIGLWPWKALYGLASLAGFALIVRGFAQARLAPVVLWTPPVAMRHLAALLTLVAFVLFVAAYVPANALKARLRHPLILSVKVWALAHLLANGQLVHLLLFGAFLLWAILDFRAARRRDRRNPPAPLPGSAAGTVATVLAGIAAWAGFALWGHQHLIGVAPLAG